MAQVNLLTNGDFESGTTGWTSSYTSGSVTTSGHYALGGSPAAAGFTANTNNVGAKSGSTAMWVNGSSSAGTTVWTETITTTANTKYTFYGWLVSAESPVNQASTIQIKITGGATVTSSTFTATTSWSQIFCNFTTGASGTSVTVTIVDTNTNTTGTGNDFGIDKLSVPEPSTYAAGAFLVAAGLFGWRRHRRALAARPKGGMAVTSALPSVHA